NCHPVGALRISVTPFCGVAKSAFAPSVMTMFGNVVNAGEVAFAAVSALTVAVPGVTATFAYAAVDAMKTAIAANALQDRIRGMGSIPSLSTIQAMAAAARN